MNDPDAGKLHRVTRSYEGEWDCVCGATGDGNKEWLEHLRAASEASETKGEKQ